LGSILDVSRYNFVYGTLGNMVVLLINIFFFFIFFFLGAQLAFVIDSFDVLLFSKLREIKGAKKIASQPNFLYKLFFPAEGNLNKYLRRYKKNEIIISQGDAADDIYYLLEGEAEIFFSASADADSSAGILNAGSFFGEMGYLLSEERCATIKAKTDVSVFVLPPPVFEAILKYDKNLDRAIIEHISRRLKNTTEQVISLNSQL